MAVLFQGEKNVTLYGTISATLLSTVAGNKESGGNNS